VERDKMDDGFGTGGRARLTLPGYQKKEVGVRGRSSLRPRCPSSGLQAPALARDVLRAPQHGAAAPATRQIHAGGPPNTKAG